MNISSFLKPARLAFALLAAALPAYGQTGTDDIASAPLITGALPVTLAVDTSAATKTGETYPSDFIYSSKVTGTLWFKWTAPSSAVYRISILGQDYDSILAVFNSTAGALPLTGTAGQNNDFGEATGTFIQAESVAFINATSGTTYYIMVGGNSGSNPRGVGSLKIAAATAPANDNIASSINLGVQFPVQSVAAENGAATAEVDEPAHSTNLTVRRSLWWRWTADATGMVSIVVQGTNPDNALVTGVYTGGPTLTSLVKVNTFNAGVTSYDATFVHFNATDGTTYYIAIDEDKAKADSVAFDRFAVAVTQPLIEVVASVGGTLPNAPTQTVATLGLPVISDSSSVAFLGTLKPLASASITTANDQVMLFRNNNGSALGIVARESTALAGSTSDTVVSMANPNLIERLGVPKVIYEVVGKGSGVTGLNNKYIVRYDSGNSSRTVAARLGQSMGSSVTVKTLSVPVAVGGTGTAPCFVSALAGTTATADSAIVLGTSYAVGAGATTLREGQTIPSLTQTGFAQLGTAVRISKSDLGLATFLTTLKSLAPTGSVPTVRTTNDTAIFLGDLPIAIEDDLAPMVTGAGLDSSIRFSAFGVPTINRAGEVAFVATLRGGLGPRKISTLTDRGIWTTLGTGTVEPALAAVAREGYAAPDAQGRPLPAVFDSFVEPLIITERHVIFYAKLRGTEVDASNDMGIWAWSAASGLRQVFREGNVDLSTGGTVGSILSFGANTISPSSAFLVNPARLDDLFIVGNLVNTTNKVISASNNLCLWHIGLNTGGNVELPECILRKGGLVSDPSWPRPRTVVSISTLARNGAGDGLASQVSRDSNVAIQVTATDNVTKVTAASNLLVRASPLVQVQ